MQQAEKLTVKELISELLRKAGANEKSIREFTDEGSMKVYRRAFIHSSVSKTENYNQLEFVGDSILNLAVALWFRQEHPEVESVEFMTRSKHHISSNKFLAQKFHGMYEHLIRFNPSAQELFNIKNWEDRFENQDYLKKVGDVFEAICGAIAEVINKKTETLAGVNIACLSVMALLREAKVDLTPEAVFDNKSRLKELYDSKKEEGWNFSKMFKVSDKNQQGKFLVSVYYIPKGSKREEILVQGKGVNKKNTEQQVSGLALERLSNMGVTRVPKDPHTKINA